MQESEQPDIEPLAVTEEQSLPVPKGRPALSKLKRELTDDELKSPGVQKLLIDELERFEKEHGELVDYRDRFYATDKEVEILKTKLKQSIPSEIISSACFVVGAAALGYSPALWATQPAGYISIIFGAVLVIAAICAKAVKL